MRHIAYITIGSHRNARRIWIEGRRLADCGFTPQRRFTAHLDLAGRKIRLEIAPDGDRMVSYRQRQDGRQTPIIDICNGVIERIFGSRDRARVTYADGRIEISMHQFDQRAEERTAKINEVRSGEAIQVGSLCTGGGILDHAIHTGISEAGGRAQAAFTVEIEGRYIEAHMENNRALMGAMTVQGSIDEIEPALLPRIHLLAAGLPCVAASLAGRAKKGAGLPECDPEVGHLVASFLEIVKATNPAGVVLENVVPYRNTASYAIAQTTLKRLGYATYEGTLYGPEFGANERRERMVLVALDPTVDASRLFDLDEFAEEPHALLSFLDTVDPGSDAWKDTTYLARKEERDLAKGSNFKRQIISPDDTIVGVIGRQYWKWRSSEPMLRHPEDPNKNRLLTPAEHARCKTIPAELVANLSRTTAHEILGQSVIWKAFRALGQRLAQAFKSDATKTRSASSEAPRQGDLAGAYGIVDVIQAATKG